MTCGGCAFTMDVWRTIRTAMPGRGGCVVVRRSRAVARASTRGVRLVRRCDHGRRSGATITSWPPGAEHQYGYAAGAVISRSISFLVPSERRDELRAIIKWLKQGDRCEGLESERGCKDGRRVAVSLNIAPLKDATGTLIGVASIARELTQRRRAEQEQARRLANRQ